MEIYKYRAGAIGRLGCTMVSFQCKDTGMDCSFEATAAAVQELDARVVQHAREVHTIPLFDKERWIKVHKVEQ